MAETAVKSAAEWLGKILVEEGKYLWGAEGKIEELRDELVWMQSFLRDADTIQYDDEIVRTWLFQIREYVSEAEDIIDDFVIKVASRRRLIGWKNKVKRYSCFLSELIALHQAAAGIDSLKTNISMLSPRLKNYGLKTSYGMKTYRSRDVQIEQVQQSSSYRHLDKENIVGLEGSAREVIDALIKSDSRRRVVAIYGMGGLGKTCLAIKVYDHDEIKAHFRDGLAWAYISQQLQVHNVLQVLLAGLTKLPTEMFNGKAVSDMISQLREFLGKNKCLVVLDDLWKLADWEILKAAFSTCGKSGSRVLLTTRKEDIAKYVDPDALHKPDPLKEDESLELLLRTVGWLEREVTRNKTHVQTNDEHGGDQPENVESGGTDIQAQGSEGQDRTQANRDGRSSGSHRLQSAQTGSVGRNDVPISKTLIRTSNEHGRAQPENVESGETDTQTQGSEVQERTQASRDGRSSGSHGLQSVQTGSVGRNDVSEMIELGREMVKHCNGLPLAIIVLGGILRKKETVDEWRSVHKNIILHLRRGSDHGKTFMEVLLQSYSDLAYHLKPCFLHLGNFPEDYEIRTDKLYWMWMAEGLVSWSHDRIAGTECLRDIANDYLSDLARSGMVEIVKKRSDGKIKSIRMHDLMRDVCLQKAAAENFLNIIDHRPCLDNPLSITSHYTHKRLLRMAIYLRKGVESFIPDSLSSRAHRYLRSFLFIAGKEAEQVNSSSTPDSFVSKCRGYLRSIVGREDQQNKYQEWLKCICNDFQMLRVLDIEGFALEGKLTKKIQNLIHLRYLNLKETKVSELPSSMGNLRFLEILDLRVSFAGSFVKVPNIFWKLLKLRHLLLPSINYEVKGSKNLWFHTLSCLETLKNLEVSNSRLEDLRKLKKLRKLSLRGMVSEVASFDHILQCPSLISGSLRSCFLGVEGNVISGKLDMLSSNISIHRLQIVGNISVGQKELVFPIFLKVLHLEACRVVNDPMGILGSLCHLKDLFLGVDSFLGMQMHCVAQSFPSLKQLSLRGLAYLKLWTVEQGSMPMLNVLKILNCVNLERIPDLLPSSTLRVTCSPCVSGIEKYGTCVCYNARSIFVEERLIRMDEYVDTLSDELYSHIGGGVMVILGRPGIGKATLAKVTYNDPRSSKFFDACAWVCITADFAANPQHTFLGILNDLAPEKNEEELLDMSCDILRKELQKVLSSKKCLIALIFLPDCDPSACLQALESIFSSTASMFLVIVDSYDMRKCDFMKEYPCLKMDLLSEEQSWYLFIERARNVLHGNDAPMKEQMGKELLKFCCGHPWNIVMLSGLMATKETLVEWKSIYEKFASMTFKIGGNCREIGQVFSLCYDELPYHLRNCLHYLEIFPKAFEISTEKLYRMWIAAGFVRLKDDQDQTDEFLENLAEGYLVELVQRGMVKAEQRRPNGRIKSCRLQYAMYSMDRKAETVVDSHTPTDQSETSHPASNAMLTTPHLDFYLDQDQSIISSSSTSSADQLQHARSLLYFPKHDDPLRKVETWGWFTMLCSNFKFLMVLELEGMRTIEGTLPAEVGILRQLRYLSLKGTWVTELPSSIENLKYLQALDLRVRLPLTIPDVLWKFEHLKHLYLPDLLHQQCGELQLYGLKHLQTLANVHTDKVCLRYVPDLKLLRKISIRKVHAVQELDGVLQRLSKSLDLSINSEIINDNPTILSRFRNLNKIRVKGRIKVSLRPNTFPPYLEELTLKHTKLKKDPIMALEKYRALRKLSFDHDSFLGKQMILFEGFPCLTQLSLRLLGHVETLRVSRVGSRDLENPIITDCWRLQEVHVKLQSCDMEGSESYNASERVAARNGLMAWRRLRRLIADYVAMQRNKQPSNIF